ncbi:zinc finger MYM-type protein 1-like [Oratosquilla oratoria]|uniref:zinc finger MYM-type protein 1-like n=1 Tax=Oratosquilla oratoria TaxID=337810 RepID=UPI003F761A5B
MAQEAKTVSALKELNFSQFTLQEKVAIKQAGRSLPEIKIVQEGVCHNKKYIHSFNCDWYQKKTWLCRCEVKNALFCFPCLLFGGDSVWSKDGFTCIKNLKEKTEKHENTKKHIYNAISLSVLGSVNIKERVSESYRLSVNAHNKKVTKNREILSKIIDCIKICRHFELPLRGHDETDDSANPGVFRGLINHASQLDPDLRTHLESNPVFKSVSKTIQKEILDCLLQIHHDQIRKEIKEAPFVAVMADDTIDVSEYTQMVIVLRYLLGEEVVERFWGFFTPENQTADGLSKCILDQLNTVLKGNAEKLIAQTFDGASVMKGKKGGVQAKIKSVYNNAHFIHCYAHQLNTIMQNAASVTRGS